VRATPTLLAERVIDVSPRTVLRWVQTFGPLLAAEVRKHRRRPGTTWYVDEVFFFRRKGQEKRYLYRAFDDHGQVLDVIFRDHRDTEAAKAFFRRSLGSAGSAPATVVSDHHQPYIAAVQEVFPEAAHVRTGLHRARGETTKSVERGRIPIRDRLRAPRGLKTVATGQRFFDGCEALYALRRGRGRLEQLVAGYPLGGATPHLRARAAVAAQHTLATHLSRAA
jgi:transposase-like protein